MRVERWTFASILVLGCALFGGCAATAAEVARGKWFELRTPRFQLWTDGDPEKAKSLVEDLERFHQVALATTTAEDREAAPPLRIFLADGSFNALTGRDARTAGIFVRTMRGNYAIIQSQDAHAFAAEGFSNRHLLFHEYTHYILAMQGAAVPSWYNEGFAEYMATTEFRDGAYTLGCPPVARTAWVARQQWLPLSQVFAAEHLTVRDASGYVRTRRAAIDAYVQSWYVVHYFSSDTARQKQLRQYLQLWAAGVETDAAIERAFGQSPAKLDNTIQIYASRPTLDCLSIKPATPLVVPQVQVRPLSEADAHYYVGDLLLATSGPTDAALELLRTASGSGKSAAPLLALARVHLTKAARGSEDAAAELTRAQGYLAEAQKISPNNAEAWAVEGHVLHLQAKRTRSATAAAGGDELLRARQAYRKAIRANEILAEAYAGLGQTYLIEDNGSEEATVSLDAAAFLLPLDATVQFTLGRIYMQRGRVLEAIPAFEFVLHWSPSDGQRAEARERIAELRKLAAVEPAARSTAAGAGATK